MASNHLGPGPKKLDQQPWEGKMSNENPHIQRFIGRNARPCGECSSHHYHVNRFGGLLCSGCHVPGDDCRGHLVVINGKYADPSQVASDGVLFCDLVNVSPELIEVADRLSGQLRREEQDLYHPDGGRDWTSEERKLISEFNELYSSGLLPREPYQVGQWRYGSPKVNHGILKLSLENAPQRSVRECDEAISQVKLILESVVSLTLM